MARRNAWPVAGLAAALILAGGTPTWAAAERLVLRPVTLATGIAGAIAGLGEMNARGDVLGTVSGPRVPYRPVLWRRYDSPIDLGVRGEYGSDLNDRGDVVGFDWYWSRGRLRRITYQGQLVTAVDVNNGGHVVGWLASATTARIRPFMWRDGRIRILDSPADEDTRAYGINDRGDVIGTVSERGVVWLDGVLTRLPTTSGNLAPRDINERGQVLLGGQQPMVWHRGQLTDLMADHPTAIGAAYDINDAGDVVGAIDGRPVLWRQGHVIQLAPPGWDGQAVELNARGDAAGTLSRRIGDVDWERRAFLWRAGKLFLAAPVRGRDVWATVVGVDARGRIAGGVGGGQTPRRIVVWTPVRQ